MCFLTAKDSMVKDICAVHVYIKKQWSRMQKHAPYERTWRSKNNKTNSGGIYKKHLNVHVNNLK